MMEDAFELRFDSFLREQIKGAKGQRLAKLQEDLTGTKLLMKTVVWPVFRSFDHLMLEYGFRTRTGSRIYVDVFHTRLRIAFEEEHYVTHAELVTRERFSFERFRVRSKAGRGLIYYPYSRDELVKKPDLCRRDLYELVGFLGNLEDSGLMALPVYEREVIRCAAMALEPFRPSDAGRWLGVNDRTSRNVLKRMEEKLLLKRVGGSERRAHRYELGEKAWSLFYGIGPEESR